MLKDFRGYLLTEGYIGYEKFAQTESVVLLNYWAHAPDFEPDDIDVTETVTFTWGIAKKCHLPRRLILNA